MLKKVRLEAGMTQKQIATKMGRPQSFIAKVEGLERRLDIVEFLDLCDTIGARPSDLLRPLQITKG